MARTIRTHERALNLLAMRAHGSAELARKLRDKGHPRDEVDETVTRLTEAGLLDDAALVAHEVERLQEAGRGPRWIRHKLAKRGLPPDLVAEALEVRAEEEPFEEGCYRALDKRFGRHREGWDPKQRLRAMRFLAGRGFSQEQVRRALGRFESEEEG